MRQFVLAACIVLVGCGGGGDVGTAGASPDSSSGGTAPISDRPPGTVIDSALPIAEHLRRFRVGVDSTDRLRGGSPTPQALVTRFVEAVARQDTIDLARMLLGKPEYAWLYYPSHIYRDPPYELDPGTFWMLVQGNSAKGLARVLRRYGGQQLDYRELRCARSANLNPPLEESERCTLEFAASGEPESRRMFGSIVGYGGSYKFVSYANEF